MKCQNCEAARQQLLARLDQEIDGTTSAPFADNAELDAHLAVCADCRREYRLLTLPRQLAQAAPPLSPSPWFYQNLRTRIESETQGRDRLQAIWKLAYRMVPALAGVTLAMALIFTWQQTQPTAVTAHNYDRIFMTDDAMTSQMLAAEQNDITYESVLTALAERRGEGFSGSR